VEGFSKAVNADPSNIRLVPVDAPYYDFLAIAAVTHTHATWFTVNYVSRPTAQVAIEAMKKDVRSVEAIRWPHILRPYRLLIPEVVVEWLGNQEFLRTPHAGLERSLNVARHKLRTRSVQDWHP